MERIELLKVLSEVNGVPGNETFVKKIMKDEFLKVVSLDDITYDGLGSIIASKVGNPDGPKILLCGHMDEVGMIVTKITKDGYIEFQTVGGWWSQVMLAQQMNITCSNGTVLRGVIGSKPPHILGPEELKNPANIDKMFIDLGVKDQEEAKALGVCIGDMITPAIDFRQLANPNYLLGKAWDNRAGCGVCIEVLKALKDEVHPNIVVASGTVQEEVGCRGARTVANVVKPDICIALDVTIAKDVPGTDSTTSLGKGPGVMIYDSGLIGHAPLRRKLLEVCDKLEIPYQLDYLKRGGTDAGAVSISNSGCPSMSLCIPVRYIHSHTSIMHIDDYNNTIKMIVEFVKVLSREVVNEITY